MLPVNLHDVIEGQMVKGLFYISSYTKKLDSGKAPLNGTVLFQGKTMNFKIWDGFLQNIFNTNELTGVIVEAVAEAGSYRDKLELTLKEVSFEHGFTDKHAFYKSVDLEAVKTDFVNFMSTHLSEKGLAMMSQYFKNTGLFNPFTVTWGGMRMHDAQVGGLMNHTLKMLKIAAVLVSNDERLEEFSDLLYISIILHDIGKILELGEGGAYTPNSFVTHRTMGVELVVPQKALFVATYGETFYYHILAVIQGHHGEYGDKPTTIHAYLIHLIDMLESQTTGFLDKWENGDINEKNSQKTVWNHGVNLVV